MQCRLYLFQVFTASSGPHPHPPRPQPSKVEKDEKSCEEPEFIFIFYYLFTLFHFMCRFKGEGERRGGRFPPAHSLQPSNCVTRPFSPRHAGRSSKSPPFKGKSDSICAPRHRRPNAIGSKVVPASPPHPPLLETVESAGPSGSLQSLFSPSRRISQYLCCGRSR